MFLSKGIDVLSLFDGMSCGRIALDRSGIAVNKYYASEIDKHAITVSKDNWDNEHLGDVTGWREWDIDWSSIDLILAGSPCQGFSFAGKQLAFDDPRSALFFVFIDILNHVRTVNPDVKFMLENVKMKDHLTVISDMTGVEPVFINSALVSAQNRQRYYWCNWDIEQPEDKGIIWGDVREHGVNVESFYYTEKALQWLARHSQRKDKPLTVHNDEDKMQMIEASHHKKYSSQRFFGICDIPSNLECIGRMVGRRICPETLKRVDYCKEIQRIQHIEFRYDGKSNCLTTVGKDNIVVPFTLPNRIPADSFFFRYITPLECERLQTVPDYYTASVSDTQRYRMLGNGWTVDVIKHILDSSGLHA